MTIGLLLLALAGGWRAAAADPANLTRAVFAEGRVWVFSSTGTLSSLADGQTAWAAEALPENVLDVCVQDARPVAITGTSGNAANWTLRRRAADAWSAVAKIDGTNDQLLAMACTSERLTLLTKRRLIEIENDRQRAIPLLNQIGRNQIGGHGGRVSATYATPDHLFVGVNAGEWGGGLFRVDHRTGRVTPLERNATGELCGGPLNTGCDPVNGIAGAPWNPGCVIAAIGLVHFSPRGRIVEICDDQIRQVYAKQFGEDPRKDRRPDAEPFPSVSFYGLARAGDKLWAIGIDGLYDIGVGDAVRTVPLPQFREVGGIGVSFDLPGIVLVLTTINRAVSISGVAPLLAPR